MRSQALDRASRRIVWIRFAGLAIVLVLAGRAAHLTVAHTRVDGLFTDQTETEQHLAPARGTIFDRTGRELAITTEAASVYALPKLMRDRAATTRTLAATLDLDFTHLTNRLSERERFTYIARWVEPAQAERIRALALDGVGIDREPRRSYPARELAAPLLGFANIDGKGVRGIEQLEHAWLTGRPRKIRVERDARGRVLAVHSTDPRDVQGGDVALTLNVAMQGAAEAALKDVVQKSGASGGFVLTMDPNNGDVLALAEAPGFDPNGFRHLLYHDTRARTFVDAVEVGSAMKAFLVASALDASLVEPDQTFDTEEGWIRVRGKTIRDRRPFGVLTPADILRVSSNVGAVQIARAVGREAQYRGLLRFGFGARTRSRFPFESTGLLRDWKAWQPVDQAAISYGQGVSVTGIQVASALAALANDGVRMEPRLVLARRRVGGAWRTTDVRVHGRAVSARAARLTLDMMQTVVSATGTGRLAALEGVRVAGKTGTAQKFDVELGRYSQDRYIAWFIGVVPADDPELAIVVAVDEPSGPVHSGGGIAAPLFARVAAAQLAHRGIVTHPAPIPAARHELRIAGNDAQPPRSSDSRVAPAVRQVAASAVLDRPARRPATRVDGRFHRKEPPPPAAVAAPPAGPAASKAVGPSSPRPTAKAGRAFDLTFVPDFKGTTMVRALRIAEHESLEITPLGAIEGRVVSQYPVPGTVLDSSSRTVRLRFEPGREEG